MLEKALSQYGIKEIRGDEDNPEVLKYFKSVGSNYSDEYAWCSAFINWCAKELGLEMSGKLNARSWLQVGISVENPTPGDVVILWRESQDSWKGHVGMYINIVGDDIFILGGNQNNMVCVKAYPKNRILGYRRLS